MKGILIIHEALHEAKEMERYILSCLGHCKVTLCVGMTKSEIMHIIEQSGNEIDICFTLVKMENISGIQIAQELRKKNAKVKVVFISDTEEYAMDAWRLGINAYLLQPVTLEKIKESLSNM